jgi:hypothetical protein
MELFTRNTTVDKLRATRKAVQVPLVDPNLGAVLLNLETMIPAKAGLHRAAAIMGVSNSMSLFMTRSKENPNPKVIPNVTAKKAVT